MEAAQITPDQLFIVYAECGRHNGSAIVAAKNKTEAKKAARNSDWLDQGRVTVAETFKEYCSWMYESIEEGIEELTKEELMPVKMGEVFELEWGS